MTMELGNMEQQKGQEFPHVRRYPRLGVPTPFPCLFAIIRSHHRFVVEEGDVGVVYDMSVKGARLMTEAVMAPGDRVVLNLRFPYHEGPAAIEWGIVRWGGAQTYGIEFEERSLAAAAALQRLLSHAILGMGKERRDHATAATRFFLLKEPVTVEKESSSRRERAI
ncbi:MAG: PilZ domain-containing protein [Nitrospira sp.]|nr:PilZ domain-containing protein [Nitrospira sp.]